MEEFEKLGEPQAELFTATAQEPVEAVKEAAEIVQPDEPTS